MLNIPTSDEDALKSPVWIGSGGSCCCNSTNVHKSNSMIPTIKYILKYETNSCS